MDQIPTPVKPTPRPRNTSRMSSAVKPTPVSTMGPLNLPARLEALSDTAHGALLIEIFAYLKRGKDKFDDSGRVTKNKLFNTSTEHNEEVIKAAYAWTEELAVNLRAFVNEQVQGNLLALVAPNAANAVVAAPPVSVAAPAEVEDDNVTVKKEFENEELEEPSALDLTLVHSLSSPGGDPISIFTDLQLREFHKAIQKTKRKVSVKLSKIDKENLDGLNEIKSKGDDELTGLFEQLCRILPSDADADADAEDEAELSINPLRIVTPKKRKVEE
ncbi:hypothetical protein BJ875DRAFT_229835 [Amylocarpus encephaloides]|uniref:Uncharacterized protein n=1 Tax=Amylocarpus encephaloides TaxID=45428 RepID=A0A9P7Y915_9HELO|nr:hypothetical protein BJ875DRAFT_229835 [Amylocarpus encephaloides]